jgi:hypothetical protein
MWRGGVQGVIFLVESILTMSSTSPIMPTTTRTQSTSSATSVTPTPPDTLSDPIQDPITDPLSPPVQESLTLSDATAELLGGLTDELSLVSGTTKLEASATSIDLLAKVNENGVVDVMSEFGGVVSANAVDHIAVAQMSPEALQETIKLLDDLQTMASGSTDPLLVQNRELILARLSEIRSIFVRQHAESSQYADYTSVATERGQAFYGEGDWEVAVIARKALFRQHVIIKGASGGTGSYRGEPGTTIPVQADRLWSVSIEHEASDGERGRSRIIQTGGMGEYRLYSEDRADNDFNDLILSVRRK